MPMNNLTPHTQLRGRYEILEQIGKGYFGIVYRAYDQLSGQAVALKQLNERNPEQIESFEREAKLLARLSHPNLPKVSDHFTEQDFWFLVMDFIPGEDLLTRLDQHNAPLPPRDVLGWADQVLAVLEYLHGLQPDPVIHRDIKPENLKLTPDGRVILLDFGIAKSTLPTGGRAIPSQRFGTRHYAPPEQQSGTGTDPRSDLYALAATIYHLLTDTLPTDAQERRDQIYAGQADPLVPPHKLNPALPPAIDKVLQRALSLTADKRHSSATELRLDIQQVVPQLIDSSEPPSPRLPWYRRLGSLTRILQRPLTQPEPLPAPAPEIPGRPKRRGNITALQPEQPPAARMPLPTVRRVLTQAWQMGQQPLAPVSKPRWRPPTVLLSQRDFVLMLVKGTQITYEGASYTIVDEIGSGSFGVVYLAQCGDGTSVAIKKTKKTLVNKVTNDQFQNEIFCLKANEHPAIPKFIAGFRSEEGHGYLVMEYIEGQDLDKYAESHPITKQEALKITKSVADTLQKLADRNLSVLHYDITPYNIRVSTIGSPYLLDFGSVGIGKKRNPQTKTPGYSPPEQELSEEVDERGVIYALGATLFDILIDQYPPDPSAGRTDSEDVLALLLADGVSGGLAALVARMMHPEKAQCHQSFTELRTAIDALTRQARRRTPTVALE